MGEASISLRGGVAAGRLPNLARLLSTSTYGESATTWPAHTAPGWASFMTARQPGGMAFISSSTRKTPVTVTVFWKHPTSAATRSGSG
ncbi:alkaline phosphatase family protein [Brevibacterium mcbrellneri]|uniref:alkaline phosphatase family protein n=1 Tax=Brevibacterium mcbrellneri TaxID=53363 RepID=UPI0012E99BF8